MWETKTTNKKLFETILTLKIWGLNHEKLVSILWFFASQKFAFDCRKMVFAQR